MIVFGHTRAGKLTMPPAERAALEAFIAGLPPGARLSISLEEEGPKRSLHALGYYWAVIVRMAAEETGYSDKEMHGWFVYFLLPPAEYRPWDSGSLPEDADTFNRYLESCIQLCGEELQLDIPPPRRRSWLR